MAAMMAQWPRTLDMIRWYTCMVDDTSDIFPAPSENYQYWSGPNIPTFFRSMFVHDCGLFSCIFFGFCFSDKFSIVSSPLFPWWWCRFSLFGPCMYRSALHFVLLLGFAHSPEGVKLKAHTHPHVATACQASKIHRYRRRQVAWVCNVIGSYVAPSLVCLIFPCCIVRFCAQSHQESYQQCQHFACQQARGTNGKASPSR